MEFIGEQTMKTSWTFAVAAVALVVGVFPAFANQAAPNQDAKEKTARQIKAAATTKYVTERQASNVQKVVDGANGLKDEEQYAYPEPGQTASATSEGAETQGAPQGPAQTQQPAPQQPAPQVEAPKPRYRFMGTACGGGQDVAMFDNGGATPVFMRKGDKLVDGTEIVEIERGCVGLLEVKPPVKKGDPSKRNLYYLYNW
jgi:hypothetical protein